MFHTDARDQPADREAEAYEAYVKSGAGTALSAESDIFKENDKPTPR